jgi:hypothetical protein
MTITNIAQIRFVNQRIAHPAPGRPEETVRAIGMVQAQDYLGALWAVGLRTSNATEKDIERALEAGQIVRTWPARGTLHFVSAQDVRWLLDLLGRRVIRRIAGRYRQLGLDDADFARSRAWVGQALQGGNRLTRPAIYQGLARAGVSMAGQRGIHILSRLAMEGQICFGPRDGKQQTFVLLDEWVPQAQTLPRERALLELARRYFSSHGPATVKDFAWWTGLPVSEARQALEMIEPELEEMDYDGQACWLRRSAPAEQPASQYAPPTARLLTVARLLPAFDEYLVGYTDRNAVLDPSFRLQVNDRGGMLNPVIAIGGLVVGTWKRALKKGTVAITPEWFAPPNKAQQHAFVEAAGRYAAFLGLKIEG